MYILYIYIFIYSNNTITTMVVAHIWEGFTTAVVVSTKVYTHTHID